jgi:hypothetical protein
MHWLHKNKQPLIFLLITTSAVLLLILLILKMRRNRKNINTTPNSSQLPAELTLAPSLPSPPSTSSSSLSPTENASPRVPTPSLLEAPAKLGAPFPGRPASLSLGVPLPPTWFEDPPDWVITGYQNYLLQIAQAILGGLFLLLFPQHSATIVTLLAFAICGSIGLPFALIAIRLWSKQWLFSLRNTGVTVSGQFIEHRMVYERPTRAVPQPQPKYYVRYRYTYNGITYAKWLEVTQKYYRAWRDGGSIPVRCFSNQPAHAYLPQFNPIRRAAAKSTFGAALCLTLLVLFVVAFMLPHFSEVVNGDNITPTPPPFDIFASAIPPTINLRPTVSCERALCTAQQIADEYCIELIDEGAASPSLYLTPVPSENTPTGAIVSDCSHEQLYCPTSDTAYTNVFVRYYYKTTNTYDSAAVLLNLQYRNTGWKISSDGVSIQYLPPLPGQECHT